MLFPTLVGPDLGILLYFQDLWPCPVVPAHPGGPDEFCQDADAGAEAASAHYRESSTAQPIHGSNTNTGTVVVSATVRILKETSKPIFEPQVLQTSLFWTDMGLQCMHIDESPRE